MKAHALLKFFIVFILVYAHALSGAPLVSSVSPLSGPAVGGTPLTISGSGFIGTTAVEFSGTSAASFSVIDDSTIHAITPINIPTVTDVIVTTPLGTSPLNRPQDYFTFTGNGVAYIPDFNSANVFPINTTTDGQSLPIPVGGGPNDITLIPNGKAAYCLNSAANSLTVIDPATNSAAATVSLAPASFPILIAITPDGTRGFTVNFSSNDVTQIDLSNPFAPVPMTTIPVGANPTGIAITPDGKRAFVTNTGSNSLTQIDIPALTTTTLFSGLLSTPSFIAFTPDGLEGLVANDGTNQVFVINNPQTVPTIGTMISGFQINQPGFFPEIAVSSDGTMAYITNSAANTISPIILATSTKGTDIPLDVVNPTIPNGIALTPDGKKAYVSDGTTNNVSIVTFNPLNVVIEPVGATPTDPAVTPDQAPVAYFMPTILPAGQASTFDASDSLSPVGSIASYTWDFRDASSLVTVATPIINHVYTQAGFYTVTLTVTNTAGTSTTQKFTGQTMSNNGGPSATTSQLILVPTTTTTVVTSSNNPSLVGQSVTFTATVTSDFPGVGTPTGTVIFTIDGVSGAPIPLIGGIATVSTSNLSVGSHAIFASYLGDSDHLPSLSNDFIQIVNPDTTTTTLISLNNPSIVGESVTFTATVVQNFPASGIPTGSVTFTIDGVSVSHVALIDGQASFTTSNLPVGTHAVMATYLTRVRCVNI